MHKSSWQDIKIKIIRYRQKAIMGNIQIINEYNVKLYILNKL